MTVEASAKATPASAPRGPLGLLSGVSGLEWVVAGLVAVALGALVAVEPDILEAPFENTRTVVFTFGGTIVAAIALVIMLRLRVPPAARLLVLGVPFVAVSWWLISPFFIDDVADDRFATSIAAATSTSTAASGAAAPSSPPAAPVLLGSGRFVGLAGHEGSGDAGFFAQVDGSRVLRLENFDIQNGPDLRLYVVPGAKQTDPGEGSLYLGELRGNVGDQTYDLPAGFMLDRGDWTVLVWCEAFSVEFVAATVTVA